MENIKSYKEHLLKQLSSPKEAEAYLSAALDDDDPHVFLLAVRDVAEAQNPMPLITRHWRLGNGFF